MVTPTMDPLDWLRKQLEEADTESAAGVGCVLLLPPRSSQPFKEADLRPNHLDTQAFSPSTADVNSPQLAALYTLQHRLA